MVMDLATVMKPCSSSDGDGDGGFSSDDGDGFVEDRNGNDEGGYGNRFDGDAFDGDAFDGVESLYLWKNSLFQMACLSLYT